MPGVEPADLGTLQSWSVVLGMASVVAMLGGIWWSVAKKSGSRDTELESTRELSKQTYQTTVKQGEAIAELGKCLAVHQSEIKNISGKVDHHQEQLMSIIKKL